VNAERGERGCETWEEGSGNSEVSTAENKTWKALIIHTKKKGEHEKAGAETKGTAASLQGILHCKQTVCNLKTRRRTLHRNRTKRLGVHKKEWGKNTQTKKKTGGGRAKGSEGGVDR